MSNGNRELMFASLLLLALSYSAATRHIEGALVQGAWPQKREAFHPWAGKRSDIQGLSSHDNARGRVSVDGVLHDIADDRLTRTVLGYLMALRQQRAPGSRNKKAFQPWAGRLTSLCSVSGVIL